MAGDHAQRRLAAILVADVVSYSRLMEADEEGTRTRLRSLHAELINPRIAADDGRIVKTTGDGILVEFPSAVAAVRNALAIQSAMSGRDSELPEDRRIRFRVGINVGDVIVEGDDIHGDGVNVASRLEGLCAPGEVYVSGTVFDQAAGKLPASFEDLGEQTLKNIDRPVRCYRALSKSRGELDLSAQRSADPPSRWEKPSIAVLPFQNMSGDSEQEYFADGITEDLITALSRIRQFFVIARNTTFTFKGQSVDVQAVARDLGVRYVIEGSVRKAANRIRITAQLIDGSTGNHLWAERYDRELEDIFAVQDEITETIVGAIEPQLHVAEIVRAQHKTPSSFDAWDFVLKALDRMSRFSESDSREAIELFDRAISADPTYARAHAHRGWVTIWRAFQGWDPMGTAIASASESIAKAVQFDADEPWAYIGRTMLCFALRKGPEAVAASRKAIELNTNFAYGYSFLGAALSLAGDGEAGVAAIAHAVQLSPRDMLRNEFDMFYAFAYFQKGDYAKASQHAAEAVSLRPGHVVANLFEATSSALLGDQERAEAALSRVMALAPDFGLKAAATQNVYILDDDRERFMSGLRQAGLPE